MYINRVQAACATALIPLLLAGCPGELVDRDAFEIEGSAPPPPVQDGGGGGDGGGGDCASLVTALFAPPHGCSQQFCHVGPMGVGELPTALDLTSGPAAIYARLVGKNATEYPTATLLDPGGDPSKSYLYLKLSMSMPPMGGQMPPPVPGTVPPDATTVACVASWIMADGDLGGDAGATHSPTTSAPDGGSSDM